MNDSILRAEIAASIDSAPVPAFDLRAVEMRAVEQRAAQTAPQRVQRRSRKPVWALAAAVVAIPVLAAAAASGVFPSAEMRAAIVNQMHLWGSTAKHTTFTRGLSVTPQQAAQDATFHLVLPSGLPAGSKLISLAESNGGKTFTASYAISNRTDVQFNIQQYTPRPGERIYFAPWVGFFQGDKVNKLRAYRLPAQVWIVGDESVTASSRHMTPAQFAAVKKAMGAHDAPLKSP